VAFDVDGLLNLWTQPPDDPVDAVQAFRQLYHDPVVVNGSPIPTEDLVARARALQSTFENVHREILDVCDAGSKVAIAFRLGGRQVGPFRTSIGLLEPSGQEISLRVIDILTIRDGRIANIAMVADELAVLAAVGAVTLPDPS
jgi:ketosteroid isomerase-like protein